MGNNPPINEGDVGSILESESYPGVEMAIHSCILTWETPWTEKPGELQSMGL